MRSFVVFFSLIVFSVYSNVPLDGDRSIPAQSKNGMVVTSHFLSTKVALEVLKKGGNAVDAAVTAGFVLAVTQPRSGNIGGGGFMLISNEKIGKIVAIDYREKAPGKAFKDMFLDKDRNVDKDLCCYSHLSSGVPGTVYGLLLALERYGTISREEALRPAIEFAEKGFIVTPRFYKGTVAKENKLKRYPSTRNIFYKKDGSYYEIGERFIQKDLSKTLKSISKNGISGFYENETADLIVEQMKKYKGLITKKDLKNYKAEIRKPIEGSYRGYDVYSMSPPSSGGIHIVQILNILEKYPISSLGLNSAKTMHFMAEAMKRAYADRSKFLGDTDFVKVPIDGLISKKYAKILNKKINPTLATPSKEIAPGNPFDFESDETTHFSIVDKSGLAVSNTYTINYAYGSGIVVEGAGFLLNNEMDDFSSKPGVPNAYGLIGGVANKIEPNKRMLSSMSPTIVKKDGKNFLVTGSPGGSRIITTTLQIIMNVIDHNLNIQAAVNSPRLHHQWLPD